MSLVEGIVGLVASVFAIIASLVLLARWMGKKFDRWIEETVNNTGAVRALTLRVLHLEQSMKASDQ